MATHKRYVGVVNSGGKGTLTNWKTHQLKHQEASKVLALDLRNPGQVTQPSLISPQTS